MKIATIFSVVVLSSASAQADDTKREKFLSLFEVTSAAVICNEKSYVIRCYGYTQGNCFERANPIAKDCVASNSASLPESLDRAEVRKFSDLAGKCIEDKVRVEFQLPPNDSQCQK